jgi:hypothetical protein
MVRNVDRKVKITHDDVIGVNGKTLSERRELLKELGC